MSKKFSLPTISISLLSLGALCLVTFSVMGSVDQNGVLREPFPKIPIGWVLLILGTIFGIMHFVRKKAHRP